MSKRRRKLRSQKMEQLPVPPAPVLAAPAPVPELAVSSPVTHAEVKVKMAEPEESKVVESVRTSHLLLVGVCFALLVALTFAEQNDASRAREDLHAIRSVVNDWRDHPYWLDDQLEKRFSGQELAQQGVTAKSKLTLKASGPNWTLDGLSDEQSKFISGRDNVRFTAPKTLGEFRRVWDSSVNKLSILKITNFSSSVQVEYSVSSIHYSGHRSQETEQLSGQVGGVPPAGPTKVVTFGVQRVQGIGHKKGEGGATNHFPGRGYLGGGIEIEPKREDLIRGDEDGYLGVHWPVDYTRETIDLQEIMVFTLGLKKPQGEFKNSFPDLHRITENYQDLPLEKIDVILASEAQRTAEKVDILGVKLSIPAIRDWGVWIALVLTIHFTLHLSALVRELKAGKVVKRASWMGVYGSHFTRGFVLASVSVLPVVTGCVLVHGNRNFDWNTFWTWGTLFSLTALGIRLLVSCSIMSVYHLIVLWRGRQVVA